MRRIFLLLLLCLPLMAFAQKAKSSKQKKKENKIEHHERLLELVEQGNFVVEISRVQQKGSAQVLVNPRNNFIGRVDSSWLVQLATNYFSEGINELGGRVIEGQISTVKVIDKGVGKGVDLQLNYLAIDSFDFFINVTENGFATIFMNGAHGGQEGNIRLLGTLVPFEESKVMVGNPTFR